MAADNAIIIGLIAASFAKTDRQKIIMFGVFAAFFFRVVFALITVQLLEYPILKIIGGALLIWIILKLIHDLQLFDVFKTAKPKIVKPKKQPSFIGGVYAVLIADVTLSFDNVLGVAAASREHTYLLIFGLLLSVFLIATVAQAQVGSLPDAFLGEESDVVDVRESKSQFFRKRFIHFFSLSFV